MALIKCPECQGSISPNAQMCPACGEPLDIAGRLPRDVGPDEIRQADDNAIEAVTGDRPPDTITTMDLIQCPLCHKSQVSPNAWICPACGEPLQKLWFFYIKLAVWLACTVLGIEAFMILKGSF